MPSRPNLLDTLRVSARKAQHRLRNEMRMRKEAAQSSSGVADMRYIVIITFGRSGSTVLQAALNSCDGVSIRGENYNAAYHLYAAYRAIERTASEHGNTAAVDLDDPWHGAHVIRPDDALLHMRELFVQDVLRPAASSDICGFKEIRHTVSHFATYEDLLDYLRFLDRLLPGVHYVLNVRDPQSTSSSGWWRGDPTALSVLTQTRDWLRTAHRDLQAAFGADRSILLEYEDWDRNPPALMRMLDALDLTYDPATIESVSGDRLQHMQTPN